MRGESATTAEWEERRRRRWQWVLTFAWKPEADWMVLMTWAIYEHGDLEHIIDSSLTDDLDVDEACRFLKVGLLCTQDDMKLRPSMSTVIMMLTGEKDVDLEKITKPGGSVHHGVQLISFSKTPVLVLYQKVVLKAKAASRPGGGMS
ncbi:LRR receptor-like serine threonine-protein kinase, partial [Musa troglodytarum]